MLFSKKPASCISNNGFRLQYSQAPTCGLSNFFCSMVHHSVSNNKRTKERELFPQLVRLLQKHGIVKKEALQQAFVKFMDAAVVW